MTKDTIQTEIDSLTRQRDQLVEQLFTANGAIQAFKYMLADITAEPKDAPVPALTVERKRKGKES